LDLEVLIALVLDTFLHARVGVALALTDRVVVGVVAVAALTNVFALRFLFVHLHLRVGIDKVHHVDNILGISVGAATAVVSLAKGKLDQVLSVQQRSVLSTVVFLGNLDEGGARLVLDGVVDHPTGVTVLFQATSSSLLQETLSELGTGGDITLGKDGLGSGASREEREDSRAEHHGD
jgi:hypothetical protein